MSFRETVVKTEEEKKKAQKALAFMVRNLKQEQNKLRMCQVREVQWVARKAEEVSFLAG